MTAEPFAEEIAGKRQDDDFVERLRRRLAEDRPVLERLASGPPESWKPVRGAVAPFERAELAGFSDPRAGEILEMRFGIGEDGRRHTLDEIGEQLSIGKERVRQIQNVSLARLHKARRIVKIGAIRKLLFVVEEGHMGSNADLTARTYDAMASVYDDFTAHHNYDLWLGGILPELEPHGFTGKGERKLLDAACGTGKAFEPMLRRGWDVTASDISKGMIEIARAKFGSRVGFTVADMRELPVLGEFDLVWALGDAVNYLCGYEDLVAALAALGRNLAPTGLLVFDTNTVQTYRTFFAQEEIIERPDSILRWTGMTDPLAEPGVIAEARLEVEPKCTDLPEIPPMLHREQHYPEAEVRMAIEQAGLIVLDVLGHGYDVKAHRPVDESADIKAIYVAAAAVA